MMRIKLFLTGSIIILLFTFCANRQKPDKRNPYHLDLVQTVEAYKQLIASDPRMKMADLEQVVDGITLDIRYATANNFTGAVIYTEPRAFTRILVAEALKKVQDSLAFYRLGLKIYDAYRPYAASLRFFEVYPDTNFVANPRKGSRHNRGCAVDLTLIELASGKEIPMPTAFDDFSPKAHPDYPDLPDTVLANRRFLFGIMEHFGFNHYPTEWWHFDFKGWEGYKLMDLTFDDLNL
jgi:zinc D-Ala-D-Ala dipeptidase